MRSRRHSFCRIISSDGSFENLILGEVFLGRCVTYESQARLTRVLCPARHPYQDCPNPVYIGCLSSIAESTHEFSHFYPQVTVMSRIYLSNCGMGGRMARPGQRFSDALPTHSARSSRISLATGDPRPQALKKAPLHTHTLPTSSFYSCVFHRKFAFDS